MAFEEDKMITLDPKKGWGAPAAEGSKDAGSYISVALQRTCGQSIIGPFN
jgi:hypothetical protein